MGLRLEIDRDWLAKNAEAKTQDYIKLYPNEKEMAESTIILDFPDDHAFSKISLDDYDGKAKLSISNYVEERVPDVYVSLEFEPTAKEWGVFAEKLVKMYNKLKNIIESV